MKKTFLLVCFLFLLAGLKAQQAKTKNTEITEHKEGGNPALKAQQAPKVKVNRATSAEKRADSVRQLLIIKDTSIKKPSTKKPYKEAAKKPAEKPKAKRED